MKKKLNVKILKNKTIFFIISLLSLFIINSCQYFEKLSYKEWKKSSGINDGVDIYIGAHYHEASYYHPCYWKNGGLVDLGSYSDDGRVYSISLDGDDIYCGGFTDNGYANACYWKNNAQVKVELDNPTDDSQINSIAVVNGVVFACGFETISSNTEACYWINGEKYSLNNPAAGVSKAQSMAVDKDTLDFYIAGYYIDSTSYACYWKNGGGCVTLPTPSTGDYKANAIAVSNGRVYAGGCYIDGDSIPCYWVDGKCNELPHGSSSSYGQVLAISIYDGSVYCAGQYDVSYTVLWKDNSTVWTCSPVALAYGVTVYDNDTYVAGGTVSPYWWKNGEFEELGSYISGGTYCIAVRAKR